VSGITGIWHRDGRPVAAEELDRMSRRLAHRGGDARGAWREGSIGLACELRRVTPESLNESQPARHPAGHVLVFDGRLDCREELLALVPAGSIAPDAPDPDLLLAAYAERGEELLPRLVGDFAFALFDPRRQTLLLVRDPIGVRAIYYHLAGATLLFGSEIKALLAHPLTRTRPSDVDLADLLIANSPLQNRQLTCFEGIEVVSPSHVVTVTPEKLTNRWYWDFDGKQRIRLKNLDEYAEAFREHFTRAVRRPLRSAFPVAFQVSGGLDSSSIFCVAANLRRAAPDAFPEFKAFTSFGPRNTRADELAYVETIERDYGIPVERLPGSKGPFGGTREGIEEYRRFVYHIETPSSAEDWPTLSCLFLAAQESGARTILTGHWGDQVLFSQDYLVDLFRRLRWARIVRDLRVYPEWLEPVPASVFRHRFRLDMIKYHIPDRLVPLLREIRARFGGLGRDSAIYSDRLRAAARKSDYRPAKPHRAFATAHGAGLYDMIRTRLYVHCLEWDDRLGAMFGMAYGVPFLDRDFCSFLMSIPGEVVTCDGITKGLLRHSLQGILTREITERRWKAGAASEVLPVPMDDVELMREFLRSGRSGPATPFLSESVFQGGPTIPGNEPNFNQGEAFSDLVTAMSLQTWEEVFFAGTYLLPETPQPVGVAGP
jgi:asparagine synthase (glutamine-hydrolysing)